MSFSPDSLLQRLQCSVPVPVYWVAFSGGLDSSVLLHALHACRDRLQAEIGAVHVNHGLQKHASEWESRCRQVCETLGVRYTSLPVDATAGPGESPEAAARNARYAALRSWLPGGHCLLTAQHRDDQAETLLLQLLRGSGVHGLAAMPQLCVFANGLHLRPLLDYSRSELHAWAREIDLEWIDDPSNLDTAFDRNYLRADVMPVLRQRWPSAAASLARSADHCAEAAELIGQLAELDLQHVPGRHTGTLSIAGLNSLPVARCRNVLRHWIRAHTGNFPSALLLVHVLHDVLASRHDAEPCVRCGQQEIRRYRDTLYLLPRQAVPRLTEEFSWSLTGPLPLPQAGGVLRVTPGTGSGICSLRVAADGVRVRWRRGGERCRPAGRQHHHSLKKLFQEQAIPPWERDRIPLIYIGEEIAAVAGLWVCEPFQAGPTEAGLWIDWDCGRDPGFQRKKTHTPNAAGN
jgi:tRNA(Ile)-lysidine synthase